MTVARHYDTVAFDVRENAPMLFFARTSASGEIEDYLLLMRAISEDFDDLLFLEINEQQVSANDLIREATLGENMLTLFFSASAPEFGGANELVLTCEASKENRTALEQGAFQVLSDKLSGGHA